jgi:hypothetical protein
MKSIVMCVLCVSCVVQLACTPKPAADVTTARAVMEKLLEAERDHRASHGNYWRDRQPKLDQAETMRNLGVDLSEASGFEFTVEPREDGMDTVLRVTARARAGAPSSSLSCVVQATADNKAECKESSGAS